MNRLFKSAYNLVNVSVGYIRVFFLVVYGKKVNARVCDIDDHIQCDNSESPSFPAHLYIPVFDMHILIINQKP